MKDFPYIRANARRCGWIDFTLQLVLIHARGERAPDDAFTFLIASLSPDGVGRWLTVSQLVESPSTRAKEILAELNGCLEQSQAA